VNYTDRWGFVPYPETGSLYKHDDFTLGATEAADQGGGWNFVLDVLGYLTNPVGTAIDAIQWASSNSATITGVAYAGLLELADAFSPDALWDPTAAKQAAWESVGLEDSWLRTSFDVGADVIREVGLFYVSAGGSVLPQAFRGANLAIRAGVTAYEGYQAAQNFGESYKRFMNNDILGGTIHAGLGLLNAVGFRAGALGVADDSLKLYGKISSARKVAGSVPKGGWLSELPVTAGRTRSGWFNFWADKGGVTEAIGYGAEYSGRLAWANSLGLRQGFQTAVRNFDNAGSWFSRMDTAVHEGFHALVGRHLPTVWRVGDAKLFGVPIGAPVKYSEEVLAYGLGHGGALRFHGIPFAPIEAFASLSKGEATTTIVFGSTFWGLFEYFGD
jgi:hypothetical protein